MQNDLQPVSTFRVTSHTRLRARDHTTSSTLIGGNGGAAPSLLLHTTLGGPTNGVCKYARWMWSLHGFDWIMFRGHLDYFQQPSLEGRLNTKPGDHGNSNAQIHWFILIYHTWIEIHRNSIRLRARSHMASHYTWRPVATRPGFGGVLGQPFGHFLLGSRHVMGTALGSCVWSGPNRVFCNLRGVGGERRVLPWP